MSHSKKQSRQIANHVSHGQIQTIHTARKQQEVRSQQSRKSGKSVLQDKLAEARLTILSFLNAIWTDKRLRLGLILLLVIAPASKWVYLLLEKEGYGEYLVSLGPIQIKNFIETPGLSVAEGGWFWETMYFWAMACGEIWAPLIAIYGIFLLFPKHYFPSYLVGIPFGYFLSLLIHRMSVSNYEEYHNGMGTAVIAMFIILGVVIFVISDKILFKKNHVLRAHEARIVGLINLPGLTWEQKEPLLRKEAEEWVQQKNELYDQKDEQRQHQAQMRKVS